jgi:hypothetical protein
MAKQIAKWSYWVGIACLVVSILWRAGNVMGMPAAPSLAEGRTFGYLTFYRGGLLFFAATIASAAYDWASSRSHSA